MNKDFRAEIYNEWLIMFEDLCLEIANNVFSQLGVPWPNLFATTLFDLELCREQNYNTGNFLSYMESNVPKLILMIK